MSSKNGVANPDESFSSFGKSNVIGTKENGESNGYETTADKYKRLDSAKSYREYKLMEEAVIEEARQQKEIAEDGNNIDLAATKIQTAYRGYKVRSEMNKNLNKGKDENIENGVPSNDKDETNQAETSMQAAYRGNLVRLTNKADSEMLEQENSELLATYYKSEEADQLATKKQVPYKGHFVLSSSNLGPESHAQRNSECSPTHHHNTNADEAATKIQAAYRRYNIRSKNTRGNLDGGNVVLASTKESKNNYGKKD